MHTIRLRGPWQIAPLDPVTNEPSAERQTEIVGDWRGALGNDFSGAVRLIRRFGLPTNLSDRESVYLVIHGLDRPAAIELNGQALATETMADASCRYHITPLLQPRNEIRITLHSDANKPITIGEVGLEIEER